MGAPSPPGLQKSTEVGLCVRLAQRMTYGENDGESPQRPSERRGDFPKVTLQIGDEEGWSHDALATVLS